MLNVLANEARPRSDATITIRIIKSFEFRTERSLILHHINLERATVGQLKEMARQGNFRFDLCVRYQMTQMCCSYSVSASLEGISQCGSRYRCQPAIITIYHLSILRYLEALY